MKKLIHLLIPANDKLGHFYLWSLIYFGMKYLHIYFGFDINWVFGVTIFTALGKELIHDLWLGKGTPDAKDFLSGILIVGLDQLQFLL